MSGRVALVTGGGRGIGRATAIALAGAGERVMAVARTQEELVSLAAEASVDFFVGSVATQEGCERIVDEARERLGPISILISNAGIGSYRERPIWEQDPAMWRESLAVNLDAAFHLIRLAVPDMTAAGWGRIVVVSSTSGQVGGPAVSAYTAAKHGVVGLMRSVAQDVIPFGVTCNAVLPGWVRTAMSEADAAAEAERTNRTTEEVWESRAGEYAAGRIPTAEEVASVIAFLVTDAASGVNGETVTVALGGLW